MGFLDELKVASADLLAKGSVLAKEAAVKAQDAADMAKIKIDIATKEKEVKDLYMKIGKAYYEAHKGEEVDYAMDMQAISEKYALIRELQSKYEMYKDAMKETKEDVIVPMYAEDAETIDIVPVTKNND